MQLSGANNSWVAGGVGVSGYYFATFVGEASVEASVEDMIRWLAKRLKNLEEKTEYLKKKNGKFVLGVGRESQGRKVTMSWCLGVVKEGNCVKGFQRQTAEKLWVVPNWDGSQ